MPFRPWVSKDGKWINQTDDKLHKQMEVDTEAGPPLSVCLPPPVLALVMHLAGMASVKLVVHSYRPDLAYEKVGRQCIHKQIDVQFPDAGHVLGDLVQLGVPVRLLEATRCRHPVHLSRLFDACSGATHLRLLKMRLCSLTDEQVQRLVQVMPHLEVIDLENNDIGAAGAAALASLTTPVPNRLGARQHNLHKLNLWNNRIGDDGVRHLATELANPDCSLRALNLNSNDITGSAFPALAQALRVNRSMTILEIQHNNLEQEGVEPIVRAVLDSITTSSLQHVRMKCNHLTRAHIDHMNVCLGRTPIVEL